MKKLVSISLFVVFVISFSNISCKKDEDDPGICGSTWTAQLSAESTALSNSITVYAADPTAQNCNAYKTAYQNYLNALKPYSDCTMYTAGQKAELQSLIAQAEADISTLCQ
jgi:uncharacterized Zn-finger protein